MADTGIFRQGQSLDITIPAAGKIAVWTDGKAVISQVGGPAAAKFTESIFLATATAGVPYLSAAFASGATLRVNNVGYAPVYYNVGLTPTSIKAIDGAYQATPGTLNATGTLTAALILGRIVTSTTGAAVAATLDTGTVMDAAATFAIGDSFDWTVINTGGNTFTVTSPGASHTIVGVAAVVTVTSATFRTLKTAAATFITYRLAG